MYIYIHMYIYIYTYIHMYIYIYIHTHSYMGIEIERVWKVIHPPKYMKSVDVVRKDVSFFCEGPSESKDV